MQSIPEQFRNAISEGSDYGMLVAADALDESADPTNNKLGQLLRCYLDIQTYVRTSNPIPMEMANTFAALNAEFNNPDREYMNGGIYSSKLGPFYTKLEVRESDLMLDIDLLSRQPVRHLTIRDVTDPTIILRNYRMAYITNLTLEAGYRAGNRIQFGPIVQSLNGQMMRRITFRRINDRLGIIRAMFVSNRMIAKGCELYMDDRAVAVHR